MNKRQAKKRIYHKTMKHGGWKKYKNAMKKAGFWELNCESQKRLRAKLVIEEFDW